MSRPRSPGSCHEIHPFLNALLQLRSSDQSFFHIPAWISCTSYPFLPSYLTKTAHGKHSHPLPVPCAALWLPHGSSGEEIKPAEAAADVPKAAQSQHKCSPLSLQISALYLFIEAPGATREAAPWSSFLVSGEQGMSGRQKGKGWVCRKITSISEQGERSKYLINILSDFTRSFAVCLLFLLFYFI